VSWFVEIGRIGDWRYLIVRSGDGFEVIRRDAIFDQVEEVIALSATLEEGVRKAIAALDREAARKKQLRENVSHQQSGTSTKNDSQRKR
jgi:hypothetical protein